MFVFGEDAMTFAIHASKNGQSVVTVRISPAVAVDKARVLESLGWQVHVTDSAGHQFDPLDFDRLSSLADEPASPPDHSEDGKHQVAPVFVGIDSGSVHPGRMVLN